jgi:hypothetical protein
VQLPALCRAAESATQAITIKDDVILLHPGTTLSKPDRKKLNEILSKFDKSLYKIEHYKDGKVTRTLGQLSDALIDKTIAAEATEAKAGGNSHATLQIIAAATSEQIYVSTAQEAPGANPSASTNPQRIQTPTPTATPPQNANPGASTNPQRIQTPTPTATPPPNANPGASTNPQRIQTPTPTATPPPNANPGASTNPQRIQTPTPTATPPPNAIPSGSTNPQTARTPIPGASTNPQHQAGAPAAGEKASRELIERLKPILEKYSKK